jgi:hypothetical protein
MVVMALSLAWEWLANGVNGGGLVAQQPGLCNGGPWERLNDRVMAHDPEKHALDAIGDGHRFSEKIMRKQNVRLGPHPAWPLRPRQAAN